MASSRDAQHARFCFEALSQLGAKRQGGGRTNPPPPYTIEGVEMPYTGEG